MGRQSRTSGSSRRDGFAEARSPLSRGTCTAPRFAGTTQPSTPGTSPGSIRPDRPNCARSAEPLALISCKRARITTGCWAAESLALCRDHRPVLQMARRVVVRQGLDLDAHHGCEPAEWTSGRPLARLNLLVVSLTFF